MSSLAAYTSSPSSSASSWKATFGEMLKEADFKKPRLVVSSDKKSEKEKIKKSSVETGDEPVNSELSAQKVDSGVDQSCQPSAGSVSI